MPDTDVVNDVIDDEDLEDDIDDADDEDLGDDDDGDDGDPDPLEALKAQFADMERQVQQRDRLMQDLTRSVGRFQSLLDRLPKDPDEVTAKMRADLDARVGEVDDILALLTDGIDDAFVDPAAKEKIKQALSSRQARATQDSMRNDMMKIIQDAIDSRLPTQTGGARTPTDSDAEAYLGALEQSLIGEITDYGLDPDDFDWGEARAALQKDGEAGIRKYFRTAIRSALDEQRASARRQARRQADQKPPRGAGAGDGTPEAVLANRSASLDDQREVLRKLGVTGI